VIDVSGAAGRWSWHVDACLDDVGVMLLRMLMWMMAGRFAELSA
jgi:hypothetical protein